MPSADGFAGIPTNRSLPCSSGKKFDVCCRPKGVDSAALHASTVEAMRKSGVDAALIYAYERTHLIVSAEHRRTLSAADLDEWDDAVAEYRETHPRDDLN